MILKKKKEIFNNLLSKQVDGIIFLGGTISDEIKDLLINHLFQSLYQVRMEDDNISVNIDFKTAAMEITEQLIQSGAKEFALVSDYSKSSRRCI